MSERRPVVAVIGDGMAAPGSPAWELALAVGERLVDAGCRVLTGGLGGVMEAAGRGARRSAAWRPGDSIAVLPGHDADQANEFVDVALPTGLGHVRNALVVHADAVVAVGGGAGTLSEMALAWLHRRLVVALRAGGWSERLAGTRIDERPRFADVPDDQVFAATTAEGAVAVVRTRLAAYQAAARRPPPR